APLDVAQVGAAVVAMRLEPEAIKLQVDLDPVAPLREELEQRVVARDLDAVRVEQDADDVAVDGRGEDLAKLGVNGRLAAADHQDVDAPVLALEAPVEVRDDAL